MEVCYSFSLIEHGCDVLNKRSFAHPYVLAVLMVTAGHRTFSVAPCLGILSLSGQNVLNKKQAGYISCPAAVNTTCTSEAH